MGNSGVARLTAYGADIDAHDAVFRMNQVSPLLSSAIVLQLL